MKIFENMTTQSIKALVAHWRSGQSKWSMAWVGLVVLAAASMWSMGSAPSREQARASSQAREAAELTLAAEGFDRLGSMMTKEAYEKASAEREASGLGKAIAQGAKISSRSWTISTEKSGSDWIVRGFSRADISKAGATSMALEEKSDWAGAWVAKVSKTGRGMVVASFKQGTIPSGSKLDPSLLDSLAP